MRVSDLVTAAKTIYVDAKSARRTRRMQRRAISWWQGRGGMAPKSERKQWIRDFGIDHVGRVVDAYLKEQEARLRDLRSD